jgi:hypothetical protein
MVEEMTEYSYSIVKYFVPEFIHRLRSNKGVIEKPSPRQGISMVKLLLSAFIKSGKLSIQNLVDVAVYTSKIENQDIAQRIALELLLGIEESNEEESTLDEDALLGLIHTQSDDMVNYEVFSDQNSQGELKPLRDSDVELFKTFTSQPDLGVGPGEDELIKTIIRQNKNNKDALMRRRLAEFLKLKLLNLGRNFERRTEKMKRSILRPYEYGEDPEDIDEERSLENILDQGKRMDEVKYSDFLLRKKLKKKMSIIYILDISNTMFYQSEGLTSIHYSVMSLVPLLWSLRNEKYGLIFYESNSHVQKEIYDEDDPDDIIDKLLLLITASTGDVEKILRGSKGSQTWGGTVPNQSLKWAFDQLDRMDERSDRICFFFSDFVLEDPSAGVFEKMENYLIIKRMIERGIGVITCISPLARGEIFSPYTENVLPQLKEVGCELIDTYTPTGFLNSVQSFIEKL